MGIKKRNGERSELGFLSTYKLSEILPMIENTNQYKIFFPMFKRHPV